MSAERGEAGEVTAVAGRAWLGYGTGMLMSRVNRRESLRLLGTALDAGITHFDTARLYGYGEAEGVLGEALRGRRDRVTITTKVGILPPRRSAGLAVARRVARGLVRAMPTLRGPVRVRAGALVQAGRFDAASVERSVEASLRELRTEYVDYLLLHECTEAELGEAGLREQMERLRAQGKVRRFGLATTVPVTAFALEQGSALAGVVQVMDSLWEPSLDRLPLRFGPVVFTHSVMGAGLRALAVRVREDAAWATAWSRRSGLDLRDRRLIAELSLRYALGANAGGMVLFASGDKERIRANARTAVDGETAGERVRALAAVFAELRRR